MKTFRDSDLQILVGRLLRVGVWLSMGIVLIGLILYRYQHGDLPVNFNQITPTDFHFGHFFQRLAAGESEAVLTLGILCLINTPIFRVICAVIGFALEKDKLYTAIAAIVFAIILISILLGAVT